MDQASFEFYTSRYEMICQWHLKPGKKIFLGDKSRRLCRFCKKAPPDATFAKVAHAIPELLGNKSLVTYYECDSCNAMFGDGIENDLGNWTKPLRTFARISGKNGVPSLKHGSSGGWRIDYSAPGFNITAYEDDPLFELDEANKRITFKLKRDPYTPVAVLKALVKIGISLVPEEEVCNFEHAIRWVRSSDHRRRLIEGPSLIHSFQPGPQPGDRLHACILRRKPGVTGAPYMYLVLKYGNEVLQTVMPSAEQDAASNTFQTYAFPAPGAAAQYGPARVTLLDMSGGELVKGETVPLTLGFEAIVRTDGEQGTSPIEVGADSPA